MAYEIVRFPHDGTIDADGHVLEPATLWEDYLSGDPDETAAPHIIDHVGADTFMWATDYPHPDHPGTWAPALERFVAPLSAETRAKVLGRNVARIYGL
jgi:hypothetical protein